MVTRKRGLPLSPAVSPRRGAPSGGLRLLRDALGGALLVVAWLALWTVTWAAVAGPLSPAREAGGRAAAPSVEAGNESAPAARTAPAERAGPEGKLARDASSQLLRGR